MVVRDESGNILDTSATSTTQLYQNHMFAIDRIRKATVKMLKTEFLTYKFSATFNANLFFLFPMPQIQNNNSKNRLSRTTNKHSHNLLVTVHAFVCKYQEDSDLLLTMYDADEMKAITENYVVKWGRQGVARDLDQFDNHRVLFTVIKKQKQKQNENIRIRLTIFFLYILFCRI